MKRRASNIDYTKLIDEFENKKFYDVSMDELSMIESLETSLLKEKAKKQYKKEEKFFNDDYENNFNENFDTKSNESKINNSKEYNLSDNKPKKLIEVVSQDSYNEETLIFENDEKKKINYFNVLLLGEDNSDIKKFIDYMNKKLKKKKFLEEKNKRINEYIVELKHRKNKKILSLLEYKDDFTTNKFYKILKTYIIDKILTFNDLNKLIKKNRKISFDNIIIDSRIHLCLFFIKEKMNIKEMHYFKKLEKYVNIIPVLVDDGIYTDFKDKKLLLKKQLLTNNLKWFDFNEKDFSIRKLKEKLIQKTMPVIINLKKNKKYDKGDLDVLIEILNSPYKNTYYYKTELICYRVLKRLKEKLKKNKLNQKQKIDKKNGLNLGGVALGIGLFGVFCFIKKKFS